MGILVESMYHLTPWWSQTSCPISCVPRG